MDDAMIGAWPFHDHSSSNASSSINRGLFGGIVVLPTKRRPPRPLDVPKGFLEHFPPKLPHHPRGTVARPKLRGHVVYRHFREGLNEWLSGELHERVPKERTLHVPLFLHYMINDEAEPIFDSGDLPELIGVFEHQFNDAGSFDYFCSFHPSMTGTVVVDPAGPALVTVNIVDAPDMGFSPDSVTVGVGGTVRWENHSALHHTVTSADGATMPTHCLNGRGFTGNTPTIVADAGQKIRWYVFNLDVGPEWHNFHPHGMRWDFAGEPVDVRSLGPAESFVVETEAPPVILLPEDVAAIQHEGHHPKGAKRYTFKADFIFHCHVHHHLRNGMVGIVRSRQTIWLTKKMLDHLVDDHGLQLDDGTNACPDVSKDRCKKAGEGVWEEVPGDPGVAMMHSALLPNSSKVLFFGYDNRPFPGGNEYSRLWDPVGGYAGTANQLSDVTAGGYQNWSLWSSEHTFLDDANGRLLVHGGYRDDLKKAYLFDPASQTWSATGATADDRFYSTTITLADGRALTLFGSDLFGGLGTSYSIEVYDPATGTWAAPIGVASAQFVHQYYPWTFLLPDGRLFIAGPHVPTHRFDWTNPSVYDEWPTIAGDRSSGGEKGTAVMLVLRPPNYEPRVIIAGGDLVDARQTAEIIDLSQPAPAWSSLPDLNVERRYQFTAVLLPDGRVFIAGGIDSGPDGGPSEIYDPEEPGAAWALGPVMTYKRTYHSSIILLPDGSVLAGGDPPDPSPTPTPHERYYPDYFTVARPQITNAPGTVGYGAAFDIDTPQAPLIGETIIMRPGAVTHGWNMSQRAVELEITGNAGGKVSVVSPPNANVAPPGWYLLYILTADRIPSEGRWIRITP